MRRIWLIFVALCWLVPGALSQRTYRAGSVLASGAWYKLSVSDPGIYKIDLAFLKTLGVNTAGLSSASIHLYGNGGQMLPEPCNGTRTDDLEEDAIQMVDGGMGCSMAATIFFSMPRARTPG